MQTGTPSVELLADHLDFVPIIARWHYDEWHQSHEDCTVDDVTEELAGWVNRDSLPLTFVAVEQGRPVGSASVVAHDMKPPAPGCEAFTPWLSGVFVVPERRGTGLGPAVVGACESIATQLGHPEIYLFTGARTAGHFYQPMGWTIVDEVPYDGRDVTVMVKSLLG